MNKKIKDNLFYIFLVAFVAFFVLSLIIVPLANKSSRWYVVNSGSMEPTLKVGDIVYVKDVNAEDVKIGDIINFYQEEREYTITHRCVDIVEQENKTFFITKGDANEENDSFLVSEDTLIGKIPYIILFGHTVYAKIPYLGYLSYFVHTQLGFFLLILLPGYALIGIEAYNIFTILQGRAYVKNGYTLYKSKRGAYFFAKESKKGEPMSLPNGYKVIESKNGLPSLKKAGKNKLGVISCSRCGGIFYCEGLRNGDKIECVYCGNTWMIKC